MKHIDLNKDAEDFVRNLDRKSFEKIYKHLREYFMSFILLKKWRFNNPEIDDCIDISIIKIWENRNRFDPDKASFITWATSILINELRYKFRENRKKIEKYDMMREYFDHENKLQEEDSSIMAGIAENLLDEIKDLNNFRCEGLKFREGQPNFSGVIIDKYFNKKPLKDMAEERDMNLSTLKTQLKRAKKLLKRKLEIKYGI